MFGVVLACVAAVVVLFAGTALGYRKLRQRRVARTLVIDTPHGIAEGRFVRLGGVDQWIQIRATDRANPILLLVNGSGLPMEPFTATLSSWEQHFTVVLWDRRDVGRTRGRNGKAGHESWTFDQLAADGIDLVEFLRSHLHQDKVIVIGHSQGSIVASKMVRGRPDLFHAYVGTGLIADMTRNEQQSHQMALERARNTGNRKALKALQQHTPPYHEVRAWIAKQRWSMATDPEMSTAQPRFMAAVLTWPTYGLGDVRRALLGALFLPPRLFEETMACRPEHLGIRYEIPVFFLQGDTDVHTLTPLAEEYFTAIQAPAKSFVRLPDTGHLTLLAKPELFLTELLAHVRPLAVQPNSTNSAS